MSKYRYEIGGIIRDTEIDFPYYTDEIIELLDEKDQQIKDLEAKVAESEEEIERLKSKEKKIRLHTKIDWFERCCRLEDESIILGLENEKLKQQLAEKEKELAYMTKQAKKFNNEAQKYFEDAYCNDSIYQDRISFAVAELEKVKGKIQHNILFVDCDDYVNVIEEIDNQIKELKKGE